ncbi:HD domain-containing protein [Clostridium weizhouense]|uniref:HD domain-containing protein n=1 Tax=Clostridium weizhouense TaxID=2859781 RepID=A0ABS7ASS3_9CLOT|nr:HD domain-containing protein [Clostridium weizhouense]MBW6411657.1 HD domain-containing protein [Clostridium weizhouense]
MSIPTFEDIKNNKEFKTYIEIGDKYLGIKGYTKHEFGHVTKVAETAGDILENLGFSKREVELAKIAGYIHDIGNMVNREEHAQTGACISFNILTRLGMEPEEIAIIVSSVGNHDADVGIPINPVSAALILADKTDVRRSRVRNTDFATFDIHDRVNYAVEKADIKVDKLNRIIELALTIDTSICPLIDYFEIFLTRMILCRKAADFLNTKFTLVMNGMKML